MPPSHSCKDWQELSSLVDTQCSYTADYHLKTSYVELHRAVCVRTGIGPWKEATFTE